MQITPAEVAETLAMIGEQHLDIRTITLGMNLRGCTDADVNMVALKVYDRMTHVSLCRQLNSSNANSVYQS